MWLPVSAGTRLMPRQRHLGRGEQLEVPHHSVAAHAAALAELQAEIRRLRDADLPPVISWAHDHVVKGGYQFWIIFALSYIERDARQLACPDCASEVRGYAGSRWCYRVIDSATCPWWRRYQAGQARGRIPHTAPWWHTAGRMYDAGGRRCDRPR